MRSECACMLRVIRLSASGLADTAHDQLQQQKGSAHCNTPASLARDVRTAGPRPRDAHCCQLRNQPSLPASASGGALRGANIRVSLGQRVPERVFGAEEGRGVGHRIEERGSELLAPRRRPAALGLGVRETVFVRLLQRDGEAVEARGDLVGADRKVGLVRRVGVIRLGDLHVRVGARIGACEQALQPLQARAPVLHTLHARDEVVRQRLVAVHVHKRVAPFAVHALQRVIHLRRALERRRLVVPGVAPLAVQVRADGIRPQVPAERAVGTHVRDDVERHLFQQRRHQPVALAGRRQKPLQQPLREPFRLRFARVLAMDDPTLEGPRTSHDHVDRASVQRLPQLLHLGDGRGGTHRHKIVVLLKGVRREISEPHDICFGCERPCQVA
mmetsp:Transcript_16723/g.40351  ORF Transcript_16723/g.40351 Transcript_16723/m.40351 type:complete len:387 (+) Transcript_16723:2730-3890(+)